MVNGIRYNVQSGDIIGISGSGLMSDIINLGTFAIPRRGLSHVGIISVEDGEPLMYESTSFKRPPCYRQGKTVNGFQCHPLREIVQVVTDPIWLYRLKCPLYQQEEQRLQVDLNNMLGRPYDFLGAFRSGGLVLALLESFVHPEDLNSIFCSEAVAYLEARLGRLRSYNDSSWNPNRLCRSMRWSGAVKRPVRLK